MRAATTRSRSSRWLSRSPQLHAGWLALRARLRAVSRHAAAPRSLPRRAWTGLAAVAVGGATVAGLVLDWPRLIRLLAPEGVTIGVLTAVPCSLWVQRARATWTMRYAGDWLSSLPATRGTVRAAVLLRAFALPGAVLAALLLLAPLLAAAAPGSIHDTWQLLVGIAMALAGGALLGWWLPRRGESSVAASTERGFARPARGAAFAGLAGWPARQTRVWLPPRSIGRLVVPILLLLPMGTSGNLAVAIGAAWSLALWLVVLLRATVRVAAEAGRWLRPTPLGIGRFAWAVAWQPTLKQIQWTLTAAGLCIALGVQADVALRTAEIWLAVVTLTTSTALARAWRGRGVGLGLLLSLCLVAAVERLRGYLGLPTAVLLGAWQLRRAVGRAASSAAEVGT